MVRDSLPGGLLRAAFRISNYPGIDSISGEELSNKFHESLLISNVSQKIDRILKIKKVNGIYRAFGKSGEIYSSKVVIVSTGTSPKPLKESLPSSVDYNIIHRDIRTLPKDLEGKIVIIIGGGEASVDSSLTVRKLGGIPKIIVRNNRLKINDELRALLIKNRIDVIYNETIVETINCSDGKILINTKSKKLINSDYLMVCIGRIPNLPKFENFKLGENGIYLSGDVVGRSMRYVGIAVSDGIISAEKGIEYIRLNNLKKK